MNWLAHLHLSEPTAPFRLGNVLPDLAPARELVGLPDEVKRGMACHRRIDAFTDAHSCFRRSVARLTPRFRRFGGIIVDVLYDHFLTAAWSDYASGTMRMRVDEFYASFDAHRSDLPLRVWPVLERMREQDWLGSYGDLAGVSVALGRISRRFRRPVDLSACAPELTEGYAAFKGDFVRFYPELCAHVAPGIGAARPDASAGR